MAEDVWYELRKKWQKMSKQNYFEAQLIILNSFGVSFIFSINIWKYSDRMQFKNIKKMLDHLC